MDARPRSIARSATGSGTTSDPAGSLRALEAVLRELTRESTAERLARRQSAPPDWWLDNLELPEPPTLNDLWAFFGAGDGDPTQLETGIRTKLRHWQACPETPARAGALALLQRAAMLARAGCPPPPAEIRQITVVLPGPAGGRAQARQVAFRRDWSTRAWTSAAVFAALRVPGGKWYRRSMLIPDDGAAPAPCYGTRACGALARIASWWDLVPEAERARLDNDYADRLGLSRAELAARAAAQARLRTAASASGPGPGAQISSIPQPAMPSG